MIRSVTSAKDGQVIEVRLPPGRRVRGKVTDPREGDPGAEVSNPTHLWNEGIFFRMWTDTDGRILG